MTDHYSETRRTLDFLRQWPDISRGDYEQLMVALDALRALPELVRAARVIYALHPTPTTSAQERAIASFVEALKKFEGVK